MRILNKKLTKAAVNCWLTLNEVCHPEQGWSIQLSKGTLAGYLDCSPTTAGRLLDKLEQGGYIIRRRVKVNNVHYASRIFVTLPDEVIQALKALPDRRQVNPAKVVSLAKKEVNKNPVLKPIQRGGQNLKGGYSKNGITNKDNNNINKLINNKANTVTSVEVVVDDDEKEEEEKLTTLVDELNSKIQATEQDIKALNQSQPKVITPSGAKPASLKDYMRYRRVDEGENRQFLEQLHRMQSVEHALQSQLACVRVKQKRSQRNASLHYLSCGGQRAMSACQRNRLSQITKVVKPNRYKQLVNEVSYAVRFGNLTKSYLSQQEISLEYSLNIACKLIREGRWETPVQMKHSQQTKRV